MSRGGSGSIQSLFIGPSSVRNNGRSGDLIRGPGKRRGRRVLYLGLASAAVLAALAGCGSHSSKASPPSSTTLPTGGTQPPSSTGGTSGSTNAIPLPARGIYLGLFNNAEGKNGTANGGLNTYSQLQSFESQIQRRIAIDLHYSTWSTPLVSPSVQADLSAGRIPLISWQCGDSDTNVASGADDSLLVQQAKSIAALGKPIMIRWFWEMDFTGNNGGKQGARAAHCIGSAGAAGYIAAWRHIVNVFRANGATNVAWVFCPGQEAFNPNAASKGRAASAFYPGDSYVDWIAEDAYSRAKPVPMPNLVANMYREYGNSGKPLIVCETGAEGSYQAQFLASFQTLPSEYPNLKAVVYFNSHGPLGSYVLSSAGMAAFRQLGQSADFSSLPARP